MSELNEETKQLILDKFLKKTKLRLKEKLNTDFEVNINNSTFSPIEDKLFEAHIELEITCDAESLEKLKSNKNYPKFLPQESTEKDKCVFTVYLFVSESGFYFVSNPEDYNRDKIITSLVYTNPNTFLCKNFSLIAGYTQYNETTINILEVMLDLANLGISKRLEVLFKDYKNKEQSIKKYENLSDQITRCFNEEYDKINISEKNASID